MIERLEVTAGPGTVIRYGSVAAWAAPSASPGLISFLAVSARNLAGATAGGQQLTDHLAGVIEDRDPEPDVAFAVVGPSPEGWAALLHGPVQVWDGSRWIAPDPWPGWRRAALRPSPSLAVTPVGTSLPAISPDSVWDLEAGVVPGGGFVLVPARSSEPAPTEVGGRTAMATVEAGPATAGATSPEPPAATVPSPGERVVGEPSPAGPTAGGAPTALVPSGAPAPVEAAPSGPVARPDEPAPVDLRSAQVRSRVVAYPPLPAGGTPGRPVPGAPVVAGVVCRRGHLNRPGTPLCVRCDTPITDEDAYNVSGTRPALGCLVLDDGEVYRLESGYLVGTDPTLDPTVRGGLARPLRLEGTQVATSHAEIRLHDWDVVLTDRESPGGTFLYGPESTAWEKLRAYQPRVLQPGTHIAFGQRVATFLTPWIAGARPPGPGTGPGGPEPAPDGQDVRSLYLGQ